MTFSLRSFCLHPSPSKCRHRRCTPPYLSLASMTKWEDLPPPSNTVQKSSGKFLETTVALGHPLLVTWILHQSWIISDAHPKGWAAMSTLKSTLGTSKNGALVENGAQVKGRVKSNENTMRRPKWPMAIIQQMSARPAWAMQLLKTETLSQNQPKPTNQNPI